MSGEAEEIRKLIAFKEKIEKKIRKLESELKEMQTIVDVVNSMLLAKGFKRAEIGKAPQITEALPPKEELAQPSLPIAEYKEIVPLKAVAGELLGKLYVGEDILRVVPAEDKEFNINTPPFTQFLMERVLAKMREKDSELARAGQLTSDKIFCYNLVREGDTVREIVIRNFDAERLRELKSSIRWTLEKMYEKMKGQS